jgi:ubiquinone/menaquinone biosynthesis C-methylase UbiE
VNRIVHPRVKETSEGIQGEFDVRIYDQMQRRFRDKGWMETKRIINSGITQGLALEVGPGPGYLGFEWLKHTTGTTLQGVEISQEMITIATRNATEYGLSKRVKYVHSDAQTMPFENNTFDAVFTNGSLHEWADPIKIFNEIHRVLKPNGHYFISDLRRDMNPLLKWIMYLMTKPKSIRPGFLSSLYSSYTEKELNKIITISSLKNARVSHTVAGVEITGIKQ